MKIRPLIVMGMMAASAVAIVAPTGQQAAQALQAAGGSSMNTLPPALRAAMMSGNPESIKQAILVLSGGDPAKMANLAQNVASVATSMADNNPAGALSAVSAALEVVNSPSVMNAAAGAALSVAVATSTVSSRLSFRHRLKGQGKWR